MSESLKPGRAINGAVDLTRELDEGGDLGVSHMGRPIVCRRWICRLHRHHNKKNVVRNRSAGAIVTNHLPA
eukprot:33203-Prorocentrum_minimum.AAC.1